MNVLRKIWKVLFGPRLPKIANNRIDCLLPGQSITVSFDSATGKIKEESI